MKSIFEQLGIHSVKESELSSKRKIDTKTKLTP